MGGKEEKTVPLVTTTASCISASDLDLGMRSLRQSDIGPSHGREDVDGVSDAAIVIKVAAALCLEGLALPRLLVRILVGATKRLTAFLQDFCEEETRAMADLHGGRIWTSASVKARGSLDRVACAKGARHIFEGRMPDERSSPADKARALEATCKGA